MHFWALFTQYLEKYRTEFHQILTFSCNAFWDKGERFSFWGQKVKDQGEFHVVGPATEKAQRRHVRDVARVVGIIDSTLPHWPVH